MTKQEKLNWIINGLESIRNDYGIQGEVEDEKIVCEAIALLKAQKKQPKHKHKNESYDDWSGAQGNDGERIKEQAKRSEWGIYG